MATRAALARRGSAPTGARVPIPGQLWPLAALSIGLPWLFLLGLGSFAWALPGIAFGGALLVRRGALIPRGGGFLLALVAWIALSGLQLRGLSTMALFGWRWSVFLSLAMTFIWLCNVSRAEVSDAAVIRVIGWTWPVLIAFGYLAILFPNVASPSLLLRLLPGGLASHSLTVDLASLRFAEVQGFLGYPVPRPSAPFGYANTWGSTVALTLPFFLLDRVFGQSSRRRTTGLVMLAIGVVPIVVSLNRGLWLSCGVALLYVALRRAATGDLRTIVRFGALAAAVVLIVLVSPLGGLINDRIERAGDSNESRASVAALAVSEGADSPLLGHGAPASSEDTNVAIGTHGLLWYLIFCHGFVAAGLFLAWLLGSLRNGAALVTEQGLWLTSVLVIALVQLPIYGMQPQVVLLGVAGGLLWRTRYVEPDEMDTPGPTTTERV